MLELPRSEFHHVTFLLSGPIFYPEAAGVVEGHNVGWVRVDRLPNPTCALVWVLGQEAFYCLGDWTNRVFLDELGRGAAGELREWVLSCGFTWFDISGDSAGWGGALKSAFAAHGIEDVRTESQYVYRYGQPRWRDVSTRSNARPINATLLSSGVGNLDLLERKLRERWVSTEEFLRHGSGYCVVDGGQLASICMSGWVSGLTHAVSIETMPEFRRKGYAISTAAALFEEYERRGITPHWDVMPSNKASIRIAETLGLLRAYEYNVHLFRLGSE